MVCVTLIPPGEIWVVYHTDRMPAMEATNAPTPKANARRHVVSERLHSGWIVADALHREPERRSSQIAYAQVDEDGGHERDVVEGNRIEDGVADQVRAGHAADSAVSGKGGDLGEEIEDDH